MPFAKRPVAVGQDSKEGAYHRIGTRRHIRPALEARWRLVESVSTPLLVFQVSTYRLELELRCPGAGAGADGPSCFAVADCQLQSTGCYRSRTWSLREMSLNKESGKIGLFKEQVLSASLKLRIHEGAVNKCCGNASPKTTSRHFDRLAGQATTSQIPRFGPSSPQHDVGDYLPGGKCKKVSRDRCIASEQSREI